MGTVVLCAPAGAPRGDERSRRASRAPPGGVPGAEAGGLHFPRCSAGASSRAGGGPARRLNAGGRSGAMELSALVRKLGNGSSPSRPRRCGQGRRAARSCSAGARPPLLVLHRPSLLFFLLPFHSVPRGRRGGGGDSAPPRGTCFRKEMPNASPSDTVPFVSVGLGSFLSGR